MSDERFTYDKPLVAFSKGSINDNVTGETYEFTMDTVLDLLNELSTSCRQLQGKVKRLNAFLVEKNLAIEYIRWQKCSGDSDD